MFTIFCLSLIGLCLAALVSFISGFRRRSKTLVLFVPIIALCGSIIYSEYVNVLGYPVELDWDQLDQRITIIYFRVEKKKSIDLWLYEERTTRLVRLPYLQPAEDALEGQRRQMGRGAPATFVKRSDSGLGEPNKGRPGQGKGAKGKGRRGQSLKGNRRGRKGLLRDGGWLYKIESHGFAIPSGNLPPK
jgi:hypothetical protein